VRWGRLVAHDRIFMQFTKFSRTGLTVSRLCLGTGTFGKQTDEAESFRVFDKASDAGLWLKGKRNRFLLGTKAGRPMGSSPWDRGSSRKHLLDAIDASLRRLNTDYVDLYQLHMDDPPTPLDETAEALDAIIRSGKARSIGVSNFLAYRLARAIGRQDTLRLVRFVSVQPRYNLLFREDDPRDDELFWFRWDQRVPHLVGGRARQMNADVGRPAKSPPRLWITPEWLPSSPAPSFS
jgi:aryl-alcohol dehydrogenase-like predicted oxidoreductase